MSPDTHTMEIREIILHRIADILQNTYRENLQELTEEYLTACMAFKGDTQLNELRLALERIRRDEYGHCIFCKEAISHDILLRNPTAHFCDGCSNTLLRRRTHYPS